MYVESEKGLVLSVTVAVGHGSTRLRSIVKVLIYVPDVAVISME